MSGSHEKQSESLSESSGPCFLVINDPKWQFGGRSLPAIDGHGVAVLELDGPAIVPHLLEFFERENPECPFGFKVVTRASLSPVQLVVVRRELQRSHDIGFDLDSDDYHTDDPTYAAIGRATVDLESLLSELKRVAFYDQAEATGPSPSKNESDPVDPAALRQWLPTAVTAAMAIRDLYRIRHFYPDALPSSDAATMIDELVFHLELSINAAGMKEKVAPFYERPGGDGTKFIDKMNNLFFVLLMQHPESDCDFSDESKAKEHMDEIIALCLARATGPVQENVRRLMDVMLVDCRIPNPVDDPTYREPRRYLQMLRHYWSLCHDIILGEMNAHMGYRPHRLMPLIVNLKARILRCCDALSAVEGVERGKETITQLLGALLEGSVDDLDEDWTIGQLQQVASLIEELRLQLGSGTLPLTYEESLCIRQAAKAISEYRDDLKKRWANTIKRIDQKRAERESQASPAGTELPKQPTESAASSSQPMSPAERSSTAAVATAPLSKGQTPTADPPAAPIAFTGGPMVFFEDRVELCDVVICGQQRSGKVRRALDLLRENQKNRSLGPYSGKKLAVALGYGERENTVAGLVRDLRVRICVALRDGASMECGPDDVILSGALGYRLKGWISVQDGDDAGGTQDQGQGARDTTSSDTDRDTNDTDSDDTDDPNDTDPGDTNDTDGASEAAAARRAWILQQLADNRRILAPDIAAALDCSLATAKRDLQALKDAGQIEFVGAARTGYYRLKQ